MNLNEIKFKIRKYWLWVNLTAAVFCVVILIILDNMGINVLWSFVIFFPLGVLGVNLRMVLTKEEIWKVVIFLMSLIYVLIVWSVYNENQKVADIFVLDTLKIMAYVTIFLGMAGFIFGYIPAKILNWKDRKIINTAVYRSSDAGYYIFPKLADEIAKKTSEDEIGDILEFNFGLMFDENGIEVEVSKEDSKNKILEKYPNLTAYDLGKIFELEEKYMKEIGRL